MTLREFWIDIILSLKTFKKPHLGYSFGANSKKILWHDITGNKGVGKIGSKRKSCVICFRDARKYYAICSNRVPLCSDRCNLKYHNQEVEIDEKLS